MSHASPSTPRPARHASRRRALDPVGGRPRSGLTRPTARHTHGCSRHRRRRRPPHSDRTTPAAAITLWGRSPSPWVGRTSSRWAALVDTYPPDPRRAVVECSGRARLQAAAETSRFVPNHIKTGNRPMQQKGAATCQRPRATFRAWCTSTRTPQHARESWLGGRTPQSTARRGRVGLTTAPPRAQKHQVRDAGDGPDATEPATAAFRLWERPDPHAAVDSYSTGRPFTLARHAHKDLKPCSSIRVNVRHILTVRRAPAQRTGWGAAPTSASAFGERHQRRPAGARWAAINCSHRSIISSARTMSSGTVTSTAARTLDR